MNAPFLRLFTVFWIDLSESLDMRFQKNTVKVIPEALLESLGRGIFNAPDAYQVEVLSELDFLNGFVTVRQLVRQKLNRAVHILDSLLALNEDGLAAALYRNLEADTEINFAKLQKLLKTRKQSKRGQNLNDLLQGAEPLSPNQEIELKYLRRALKDSVHDYREVKVGRNLMQVCFLMPPETRLTIWNELRPDELYQLSAYLEKTAERDFFWLELPQDKLPGLVHEMKNRERSDYLALLLQDPGHGLKCLQKALKGLYHVPDCMGECSDAQPLSDQGRLLRQVLEKEELQLTLIAPEKLALVVAILLKDEEDRGICSIFKREEITREQMLAVDGYLKQAEEAPGAGLKHLIETIHDHEGLFSLSTTTSRAYPVLQELKRLELSDLLSICIEARL